MIKQSNIKMPLACWKAIVGKKEECNLLDDGTIEHVIMHPEGFFDDGNNKLEWIAAWVRVSEDDARDIRFGWDSPASVFADNYDTNLLEITFEV